MTTANRVGVGVVGAGVISSQYLDNLTTFADVEVLFIADIDTSRAAEQSVHYEVPGSGTVAQLLAHPDIEIVVNLTIPAAHVEVALQALAAGKHVFTEKPFALDRESGRQLLEQSKKLGLRAASAPDTFLGSGLQTAKRMIDAGDIGTPTTALTLFQVAGPEAWHPNPEFLYAKGGGPLFDMGPYYLTALIQNLGSVARVATTASTARSTRVIGSGPRAGVEFAVEVPTNVSAIIEFESGASAHCIFSFESGLTRTGVLEISGTEGTLVLPDPNSFGGEIVLHAGGEVVSTTETEVVGERGVGVVELARAIRAGVPERASSEQAFHVLDVMVAITEAAESGAFVTVESSAPQAIALPIDWDPREATL